MGRPQGWGQLGERGGGAYLLATLAGLVLRWPTLTNRILSIDEPSYFVQAALLGSLQKFVYAFYYRVETKTQIGLLPYILAAALDRHQAVLLLHIFGLLAVLLSCGLLIALAARFLGSPWPGLVAALIWLPYLNIGPAYDPGGLDVLSEFPAILLEYFQTPCILLSLYGLLWGLEDRGGHPTAARWMLAGAGVAWALAVLIKPSAVLLGLLYLLALAFSGARGAAPAGRGHTLLAQVGAFGLGAALPVLLVFIPYLFNPSALQELRFNLIDVNATYTAGGSLLVRALALLLGFPPLLLLAFLLTPPLLRWRHPTAQVSPALSLILWAGPLLFLGILSGAGFLHYLIPIVPLMALAVAGYLYLIWSGGRSDRPRWQALLLGGLLAAVYWGPQLPRLAQFPGRMAADTYLNDDRARFDLDSLVMYIQTHTQPNATLWVYYNSPEVYLLADRQPTTRDPASAYLTLYWAAPWFQRTATELAAATPDLLVGINNPRYPHPNALPITQIPQVSELIAQAYRCDAQVVRGVIICQRNTRANAPAASAPPPNRLDGPGHVPVGKP